MQRLHPLKRLLGRVTGDSITGTHERAPDGFLLAYGTAVQPGRRQRGSIVDVTPTVLYFWACRSAATWTASRDPISSRARSPPSARSRSFRRTIAEGANRLRKPRRHDGATTRRE